ncbi:MAG TPA: extracellular solute-binding protein [Mycobacteriales bacterium]|nr:extracellular solute-binding protein [Mycobacteriales bacterium]
MTGETARRDFLRVLGGGAIGAALAGCGTFGRQPNSKSKTTLWYWNRSLDDDFLAQANKQFPSLNLEPNKIAVDFKPKVLTTLAGGSYVPDITNINSDIATYFPDESQFVDLYDLGAKKVEHLYLPWKWDLGITAGGKMVGFPIDTGPTAFMYRMDLFEKAGLPSDPAAVEKQVATWDGYFDLGTKLQAKVPSTKFVHNINTVYTMGLAQSPKQYFDKQNKFIGDQAHVKNAWDNAVEAKKRNLSARVLQDWSSDWSAAVSSGGIATVNHAVWAAYIVKEAAPDTSGKWRVCHGPGPAGNSGGSFMSITKYSRRPELAFEFIKWLQSPDLQTKTYNAIQLFPSATSSLADKSMETPDKFFGGQPVGKIFGDVAKELVPAYYSPYESVVSASFTNELLNVENLGKNPDKAWEDALSDARRQIKHKGLSV